MDRWRFWAEQVLSKKSLVSAGAAAVGLVGWATTQHPVFAWLMLGGGGVWTALMYYLGASGKANAPAVPSRGGVVSEVEHALRQFPAPGDREARERWRDRERQLRRIVGLERLILTDLPATPSGVSLLSPEHRLEVTDFVDRAEELARRRVLLVRALLANPMGQLQAELHELMQRRQVASARIATELDELIALKREQAERIKHWEEDLRLTEINLDQIETFLRAVAYDQALTPSNVGERIARLKSRVQFRRESLEELERRMNEATG